MSAEHLDALREWLAAYDALYVLPPRSDDQAVAALNRFRAIDMQPAALAPRLRTMLNALDAAEARIAALNRARPGWDRLRQHLSAQAAINDEGRLLDAAADAIERQQQRIAALEGALRMLITAAKRGAPYNPTLQGAVNDARAALKGDDDDT